MNASLGLWKHAEERDDGEGGNLQVEARTSRAAWRRGR